MLLATLWQSNKWGFLLHLFILMNLCINTIVNQRLNLAVRLTEFSLFNRSRRQSFWTWKSHWFYGCCLFFTMHPQHLVGIKESLSSTWWTWISSKSIYIMSYPFRSRRQSFWTWKSHWFYSCCLFFTMHPQHLVGMKETLSSTWWTWISSKSIFIMSYPFRSKRSPSRLKKVIYFLFSCLFYYYASPVLSRH